MLHTLEQPTTIVGRYLVTIYDTRSNEAQSLEREIQDHIAMRPASPTPEEANSHHKIYRSLIARFQRFAVRKHRGRNLIATEGRSVIAQRLSNTLTYDGVINYGALGTSTTTPTDADTQLTTEVFRKVTASTSFTTKTAFIDFFYSKTDTNGTYEEFGTFINGTATINTGQLFTHTLTGGWVKTASESMTVAVQYDVN